jgi:hypothetical protein
VREGTCFGVAQADNSGEARSSLGSRCPPSGPANKRDSTVPSVEGSPGDCVGIAISGATMTLGSEAPSAEDFRLPVLWMD